MGYKTNQDTVTGWRVIIWLMEKHSQSMFVRSMLNALCILTQILKSWLVITLKWNARVVYPSLNSLGPPPPLDGNKGLRTNNTTRVFHFRVITSQDLRICVNIRNALSVALTNMDCECFSITHVLSSTLLLYLGLFCIPFILWFRIDYTKGIL
jgi:hypothetical protein